MSLFLLILMFSALIALLMIGVPVAFSLIGASLFTMLIAINNDLITWHILYSLPQRYYGGILRNEILLAIPLFIMMGKILEYSQLATRLFDYMRALCKHNPMAIYIACILVGAMLAASSAVIGASVAALTLICLPMIRKQGGADSLGSGVICSAGALGQFIPPSIMLLILSEQIAYAHINAQYAKGNFAPIAISANDVFSAALLPSLVLILIYSAYIVFLGKIRPGIFGKISDNQQQQTPSFIPFLCTLLLIFCVLGAIIGGIATPSEAACIGVFGALIMAYRYWNKNFIYHITKETLRLCAVIFMIIFAAHFFVLILRAIGGDSVIADYVQSYNIGFWSLLGCALFIMFVLGFFLDFLEISLIIVPIIAPLLLAYDMISPIHLAIIFAAILQTSLLTPPFGLALFYFKTAAQNCHIDISLSQIYKGVMPFVLLQLLFLMLIMLFYVK